MRRNDHMARRFIAVFLASVLAYGNFGIQVALGVEATGGSVDVVEKIEESESAPVADDAEEAPGEDAAADEQPEQSEPESQTQAEPVDAPAPVATISNDDSTDPIPTSSDAESAQPYSIFVTFDGQELSDKDDENNFIDSDFWTSTSDADAKKVSVTLVRNRSVSVDPNKDYILALSLPTVLNFGGIPTADKLPTGTTAVALKKNSTFQVNKANYGRSNYTLSQYSGEMRFELNTAVDRVDVTDLYVFFDPVLIGYKTNGSVVENAFSAKVVTVNKGKDLATYDATKDATSIEARNVNSVLIKNSESVTDNMSYYTSNNGFMTAVSGQGVNAAADGSVSYSLRTGSMTPQVYSSMKLTFAQPYVLVGTEKHYLDFDEDEEVLTTNRTIIQSGWRTDTKATYNEVDHTITYYLKDVLTSSWCPFVISPKFKLPSDLAGNVPDSGYQIRTDGWRVIEQKTYLGDDTTQMPASRTAPTCNFVKAGVNVKLGSSNNPLNSGTSQRFIYKKVTSGSGLTATIGLFDVHNEGVSDSPEVKVEFKFNTNQTASSALYKATRLNVPFYGMGDSAEINYVITNGSDTKSGTTTLTRTDWSAINGDKLYVFVSSLTSGTSGYYLEELSYTTKLRNSTEFHTSVTHGGRNYVTDPGVFTGVMDGEVGQVAEATMTITSVDGSAITSDGKASVAATEKSTISDDNSTSFGSQQVYLNGSRTAFITAGETMRLSFKLQVSDEEFNFSTSPRKVNGYHVVESPIVYLCLPEDVSIAGVDQAHATMGGKTIPSTKVEKLKNSDCTLDGRKARWWAVEFDNANVTTDFTPEIQLSTDIAMEGVAWNFSKKIAVRAKGQKINWALASSYNPHYYNNVSTLQGNSYEPLKVLGTALSADEYAAGKLGMVVYETDSAAMLNVARAEAKLDVRTSLSLDGGAGGQSSLKVTNSASEINYNVTVASDDGGHADDFSYYIPVPKVTAGTDANMFVSSKDFSLALDHVVETSAADSDGKALSTGNDIFKVEYTTQEGLISDEVRKDSVVWQASADDLSKVTAVRISTVDGAMIDYGSSYKFHLTFKYQGDDFNTQAGRSVQWRSFGHYSYQRGSAAPTTNSYPSQDNSVRLGYKADYTKDPIVVTLDTGAADNVVSTGRSYGQTFKNAQNIKIKNVTVPDGTILTGDDPTNLTGSEANSTFRMAFGINNANYQVITKGSKGGGYTVPANTAASIDCAVRFSRALTDIKNERYVDVTLGNDDIDVTVRFWLERHVAVANVDGSGTAEGEQFKAASVNMNVINVPSNAAFTALYYVKGFIPGNFSSQKLEWKQGGNAVELPTGTNITMMVLGADNSVESWWLHATTAGESSVDLRSFKRMGGGDNFVYATDGTNGVELKYQFVVSFPEGCTTTGTGFSLGFTADAKPEVTAFTPVELKVNLVSRAEFGLTVNDQTAKYTYTPAGGSDSRTSGKLLALVVKPTDGVTLPADAKITAGGKSYSKNVDGAFIVPLSTVASGSVELGLTSAMAPDTGGSYNFDVSLMLYSATSTSESRGAAPMAGLEVGNTGSVTLGLAASTSPSLKVSGDRVATKAEWIAGKNINFEVKGLPADGTLTVKTYKGLTGSQQVTDLLSTVVESGKFELSNGMFTYKGEADYAKTGGKLVLGNNASAGTYRLVFEVKRDDDVLLSVPYYIVVRE